MLRIFKSFIQHLHSPVTRGWILIFWIFQSFQRIQRNRQSRIRIKLSRRAGKRQDEVLEEDSTEAEAEVHIDIIGEAKDVAKPAKEKGSECKAVKHRLYGPEQFSEEDVVAAVNELESSQQTEVSPREEAGSDNEEDPRQWCSQCQVCKILDY